MKNRPLKILALPVDNGGCGWYRVRQPFAAINKYTDSEAHVIDKSSDDPIQVAQAVLNSDILLVRQGGESGVQPLIEAANGYAEETKQDKRVTAKIVLDIDDNVEIISPYSQHYKEYGTKEFHDEVNNKDIWKHGEQGFDVIRNRQRLMSFMLGMRRADLITVTTEKLAEYARHYNKNVAIMPNAINTDVWWKPPFKDNEQLRIGWSGGMSHYEDWETLKEPLNKLLRKHQFKLVLIGSAYTGLIDQDLQHLIEVWPWVPFEAHSYRMMLMNLDIAVIPLADLPFNHYKSAIKLYEMSAMGVPSLVANVEPYNKSDINAAIYYDKEDFIPHLEALINKADMRKRLGLSAYSEVQDKWTDQQHAETMLKNFRSIL